MGESQSRLCARGRTGRPRRPGPAGRNYRGGGCWGGRGGMVLELGASRKFI